MKSIWGGDKGERAGATIGISSINNSNEVNLGNNKRYNGNNNNQINIDLIEPGVMIQSIQPNKYNFLWNSYMSIDNESQISND